MSEQNEFLRLETALVRVGRELDYPATPALAVRVRAELVRGANGLQPGAPRNRLRALVPIAAAILLALALLLALPTTRDAIGQILGLPSLRIFYITPTPVSSPTAQATAPLSAVATQAGLVPSVTAEPRRTPTRGVMPTPTFQPFTICCEMSLAEARRRAHFPLLVPRGETPTKIYFQELYNDAEQVVMVFGDPAQPRFTLYQAQRWIYAKMLQGGGFGKVVDPQTIVGEAQVRGVRALWFSGAPHIFMSLDVRGNPVYETRRVVDANTLVWETGDQDRGVIYRIESTLPLNQVAEIAESLE